LPPRGADAPAPALLVHVRPGEGLQLADSHPRPVEHKERQAVEAGEEPVDGDHVLGARRHGLSLLLAGELDPRVPSRVRLDAVMVEDHRQDGDRLADRRLVALGHGPSLTEGGTDFEVCG
jgi:hypothetical protein